MKHIELARCNMVNKQLRPCNISDHEILDLMQSIPREKFLDKNLQNLAYADINLPITENRTALAPVTIARILQALALDTSESVLELGSDGGYFTTLLAKLSHNVVSIEPENNLFNTTKTNLNRNNLKNVELINKNISLYFNQCHKKFDVIIFNNAVKSPPDILLKKLTINGRLFTMIGEPPIMEATLIIRESKNNWSAISLFETLINGNNNFLPDKEFLF